MKRINILSIDDDQMFNSLLSKKLDDKHYFYTPTTKVADFLKELKTGIFDLCLIDVNLSEGNESGFTLINYIRTHLKNEIPIFIMSRVDDNEKISHGLDNGANDYLTKPFDLDMFNTKTNILRDEASQLSTLQTLPVPTAKRECSIMANFQPYSISEEGITLVGPNCLSKGAIAFIENTYLNKILNKPTIRLVVSKNAKISENYFSIFLEYGPDDMDLIENSRSWILSKLSRTT